MIEPDEPAESAAPTELAGVAEADTMSAYAWSEDDGLDDVPERGPGWPFKVTAAAVGVSLSLVAVAGVLGYRYATDGESRSVAVSAPFAATTSAPLPKAAPASVPPPPPVTVTTVVVQSTVPVPEAPPSGGELPDSVVAAFDQNFLTNIKGRGWVVWDEKLITHRAHQTCAGLQNRTPLPVIYEQMMASEPQLTRGMAIDFVDAAMATYPDCP